MRAQLDWTWLNWQLIQTARRFRSLTLAACGCVLLISAAIMLEPQPSAARHTATHQRTSLLASPHPSVPSQPALSDVNHLTNSTLRSRHIASILGLRCDPDFADAHEQLRSLPAADKE